MLESNVWKIIHRLESKRNYSLQYYQDKRIQQAIPRIKHKRAQAEQNKISNREVRTNIHRAI